MTRRYPFTARQRRMGVLAMALKFAVAFLSAVLLVAALAILA